MTASNNGFYLLDSESYSIISDEYVRPNLPINFPRLTRSDYLNAHLELFVLLKFSTNHTTREYDEETIRNGIEQESIILKREQKGIHSLIRSEDNRDILRTIKILNESYVYSTQNFYKMLNYEFSLPTMRYPDQPGEQSVNHLVLTLVQKLYRVVSNYASAKLMNDNFYAFSYNQTLLDMNLDELKSNPNLRLNYIQVDSMNKCVPQDWFLGYDQFAVYTFLKLSGQQRDQAGFLKTYFRPKEIMINLLNNLEVLKVDYGADFSGSLNHSGIFFMICYFWMRFKLLVQVLFQLAQLHGLVVISSKMLHQCLFEFNSSQRFLSLKLVSKFILSIIIIIVLPYSLSYQKNPFSTGFITYTTFLSYNFSIYFLQHSKY